MKIKPGIILILFLVSVSTVALYTSELVSSYIYGEKFIITNNGTIVDEMFACCIDLTSVNYFENNSYYNEVSGMTNLKSLDNIDNICITEENSINYDLPCNEIEKKQIDRKWLDLNAECLECYNKEENWISYEMPICEYKCNEYKFGDYIIK